MISERDGIHIDGERLYVADSRAASGDVNIVSHAHFDHLHLEDSEVVCSETTARLAEARTGEKINRVETPGEIELIESGHILGSRSVFVETEGERILYTGDFSPRNRQYLEGFQPQKCDVMVVESTYGIPAYRFPPQEEVETRIVNWIEDNDDTLFLFGYSLGKAQKIQRIVQEATDRPIVAHGAVKKMNNAVESIAGLEFRASSYSEDRDVLEDDGIFIGPSRVSTSDFIEKMVDRTGGLKAGFSGWAVSESFRHRGGYDKTFVLSDHADFDELVEAVRRCDPRKVYTTHGFDEALASHLSNELGYTARALKKNQSSLKDF
ncbi:MAG: MBL fold metallo-hydrolase RNA specificity domain-containing protein [Candidatus Nanohaloarchaea archaeon]